MGTATKIEFMWKGTISGALSQRSISAAWFYLAFSLSLLLIILIPVSSSAYGLAGKRFFPSTTLAMGNHAGYENSHHEHYASAGPEPVVHLETSPSDISVGTPGKVTVNIEDRNGKPVEGLTVHHEYILHAIIIGEDLNVFAHIHPENIGPVNDEMLRKATFPLRFTFPKAGKKKILRYFIKKNVKPVTDFEPYLGSPMHLAVVLTDLKQFIHTHGIIPGEAHTAPGHMHAESTERFGPEIEPVIFFLVKRTYKIF